MDRPGDRACHTPFEGMLLSDGCKECHHVLAAHYASGPKKFWCSICEALNGLKAP